MCFRPGYFISAQNYLKVRDIFCFQYEARIQVDIIDRTVEFNKFVSKPWPETFLAISKRLDQLYTCRTLQVS